MCRLKKTLRLVVLTFIFVLALAGIPVFGTFFTQKRDDLFDNELKIEQVELNEEKTELPDTHELM